ncbi:LLM class flavin-dependent oxidoreductase [Mesorhizobium sp. CA18]|uniref:LLM class flavin-dependent oxidoreductase n=1 Tax=unclassified Mesorhizobium TaxID=325217 RepID=UPI000BB006ED|nr:MULTISPECIES: LLM class flavin-dependent oxidoreductase [unclassified Mesorhizobium]MBZ9736606.1 LLM class flavin-dependent oxidoreductase [Mesorhizobium sp. CA9]MBZ9828362.1 LLM class flavin-dependent oxidoreductase [Mesorhizobium sp. CA18]MBZ9834164.1 LLM class flavin-dependent oxidoreductase [Mesorhizobium sp. CA2]MBZ9840137.1 LLM class flavin-dependent oxidoreductase [Mesorhizobium sp. CA3]MBZ9880297.1 LLM class flavin-dependent oxidoreductase [Mesorhizobium sp. Ca11]
MPIEFTHVPDKPANGSFFYDFAETATKLSLIEDSGFRKLVVDDPAGLLTNMDIAAQTLDRTGSLEVVLTHWAGVIEPTVAAGQLAALDRRGGGRLSLRMLSEPLEDSDAEARPVGHSVVWQRIDEYLVLLKRLWSNDRPFDHEGAFYSVRDGFVPRKGPHGADLVIRLGGQSGTALKVAGKHADVFELAAGSPDEVRQLMERARSAAAEHGRGGRLRFALPVRIRPDGWTGASDHKAVEIAGPPARLALALLPYAALGVEEFMIGGIDRLGEIARIGRETIALVANSLARREAEVPQPGALASHPFAQHCAS